MPDPAELDNPIWNALTGCHAALSRGEGAARAYLPEVSPLSAVRSLTTAALDDLRSLARPGQKLSLLSDGVVEPPRGMAALRELVIEQMVCAAAGAGGEPCPFDELGERDVPAMLELTALTQPGPFLPGTIRMGRYIGVKVEGRLAAMAGQRMKLERFTEISAVCTHPDFRGRGYAAGLMATLIADARSRGRTPFLHVKAENTAAKSVYARLGFSVRRPIRYTVLAPA